MIAWWGWVLIWSGLVLAMLTTLALLLWRLFRKGVRVLDELGGLADAAAVLEVETPELTLADRAVLVDLREIRRREEARRAHRSQRRRLRHERRMARARRITRVDPATTAWPDAWYR